ncbi:MAG: hypothetical protein ACE3JR_01205 [Ectobacillus sp.]
MVKEIEKRQKDVLEEYKKGLEITSESKVGEVDVKVYGELDVERLVKRLLNSPYITKRKS